jgi:DNA-binding MarR family transcriptional regulator
MSLAWSKEMEDAVVFHRNNGMKFDDIAEKLNITTSAIKHKFRRISQNNNIEKHHHPKEKWEQVERYIKRDENYILETNCGWGNLTKLYQQYGEVLCYDIDKKRVDYIKNMQMQDVYAEHGDSIIESHRLVGNKCKFDIIDLDPYGMPSRYFPHIFLLMNKGYLFVTLPKLGVQKLNKITAKHLDCFWGIGERNRKEYEDIIIKKIVDFGMQNYRDVVLEEIISVGSIYRMAFRVEKKSSLDLVGLAINRNPIIAKESCERLLF